MPEYISLLNRTGSFALNAPSGVTNGYSYSSGNEPSIFLSAKVYKLTGNTAAASWITQQTNGSYANNLTDTCSVLINLPLTASARASAEQYLLSLQENAGHWGNIYTTALCLQALTSGEE